MIWATCAPGGGFSLIPWLFMNRFGHDTYQIEAEYPSYRLVPFILLLINTLTSLGEKSKKVCVFHLHL